MSRFGVRRAKVALSIGCKAARGTCSWRKQPERSWMLRRRNRPPRPGSALQKGTRRHQAARLASRAARLRQLFPRKIHLRDCGAMGPPKRINRFGEAQLQAVVNRHQTRNEFCGFSPPDAKRPRPWLRCRLNELHNRYEQEKLLQIIEIGRDGCNLCLGQAVRDRLHDGRRFVRDCRVLTPLSLPVCQFLKNVIMHLTG